jgi:hypothetical protein
VDPTGLHPPLYQFKQNLGLFIVTDNGNFKSFMEYLLLKK